MFPTGLIPLERMLRYCCGYCLLHCPGTHTHTHMRTNAHKCFFCSKVMKVTKEGGGGGAGAGG